jgi:hypothetical protein
MNLRKRILRLGLIVGSGLFLAWIVPKPLSGYWHTPYSDCLCSSKNLLQFRDGKAYRWATAHNIVGEPYGTYRRGIWWVHWDTGEEVVRIRPGFFFIELRSPDDHPNLKGMKWKGYREWRREYISEVLSTEKKNEPNKAMEPTPVDVTDPAGAGSAPSTSAAHL